MNMDFCKIDYNLIRYIKGLTEKQFVNIFNEANLNYFTMNPGFINRVFLKNILVCYLDINYTDDVDDSICKKYLRAYKINYKLVAKMSPSIDNTNTDMYETIKKYQLNILMINKSDFEGFVAAAQKPIINAFNNRESEYYTVFISVFKLYMASIMKKEPKNFQIENMNRYNEFKSKIIKEIELIKREEDQEKNNNAK